MLEDQIFCPACGTDTDHTLIKSGQENLVRCDDCGTVHPVEVKRERLVNLNWLNMRKVWAIISTG